jgi:tetratricopeptide (TPR) repeat protein
MLRALSAERLANQRLDDLGCANAATTQALAQTRQAQAEARAEADNAQRSAAESEAVRRFLENDLLAAARPEGQEGGLGKDATIHQAVDAVRPRIAEAFKDQPAIEAAVRDTLGQTYGYLGEYDTAIRELERAVELRQSQLSPDHPDTLTSRNNLAEAYREAGRTDEAITMHEATLKFQESKLGPDLTSRNNLALAYKGAGRLTDALPLYEQTLKFQESKLGPDHPNTLTSMNNLARAYQAAGRLTDALPLFEESLRRFKAKLGPDHPNTLTSMNNLAGAYLDASRWAEAETTARECLSLRERKQPEDWWRYYTMSQLGAALAGQKKYAEAEPLILQGYEGLKARAATIPAPRQNSLAEADGRVVKLYEAWGKADEADEWRKKLGTKMAVDQTTKPK